jgi:uncharacterized phage-associated protein
MYSAKAIANEFVKISHAQGAALSPMKLQKLLYFAHGWNLALTDKPLLDEEVEAWQYGPVVPSVYHDFKQFGSRAIPREAVDYEFEDFTVTAVAPSVPDSDEFTHGLIKKIWSVYGRYDGVQLSKMTHEGGTPWANTWREDLPKGTGIKNEDIENYFKSKVK